MRKLVWFSVPLAAAMLLCVYFLPVLYALLFGAAALAACVLCGFLVKNRRVFMALLGLAVGFLWCFGYEKLLLEPIWSVSEQTREVTAQVSGYPDETDFGSRVAVKLRLDGHTANAMLYLDAQGMTLEPGDTVCVSATLRQSTVGREDAEFLYFQSIGVQLLAYAEGEPVITKCEALPLMLAPVVFAGKLRQTIGEVFPPDAAGFLQALLTGDKRGMDYPTRNAFSLAGVSHVIAISGMHVSMLLGMIGFFTGRRRKLTAALAIPTVLLFALMTGGSPSVWRAALMLTLFLLAPLLNRQNDPPTSLCAAMTALLLLNPWAVSNISFQLSFAAMAGIVLVSGKLGARMRAPAWVQALSRHAPGRLAVNFIVSSVSMSLGAQIFTVPIVAVVFGTVGIYCVAANILILWAVSLVFCAGLLLALLGMASVPIANLLGVPLTLLVRYILGAARWISELPYASLGAGSPYLGFWLVFVYLLLALWLLLRKRTTLLLPLGCMLAGLAVALFMARLDAVPQEFYISVLNVGQGQSIVMQTPSASAVCDCGGSEENEAGELAARTMLNAGGQLDCLILTHYDDDHVNGVEQLLRRVPVGTVYLPPTQDASGNRARIETAASDCGAQLVYVHEDTQIALGEATIRIFAPLTEESDNDSCLSVLFTAGEYDMLITGDMDTDTERLLALKYELPDTELFIAGHHGSKYASSDALLSAIMPETVIVSVGYNTYGHPTQETLARFARIGATVYRTDACGTVRVGR